ncbi:class I SAM-dependent methyltransferase [Algirhabdus cladophorae]|uniref:class I SAM-dependent methyltransferase n=1 Tax=Algirhabdus cladophorae TaxID=3377108 RepID=UPI003B847AD8
MSSRLSLAAQSGLFALPVAGRVCVYAPNAETDLSLFDKEQTDLIVSFYPDATQFAAAGWTVVQKPEGPYAAAVVILPRSKTYAKALLADANTQTTGQIVVDGGKTDGIDSLLKACKSLCDVSPAFSKAHGKTFVVAPGADLGQWAEPEPPTGKIDGFVTRPGVFSAEKIDAGSAALVAELPKLLGAHVIDLGAGWGFLSASILTHPEVQELHLVEADARALDCARRNIDDPRAQFHWADARQYQPKALADCVITNPPFHTGRKGDPDLGKAFIAAAAKLLKPSGHLLIVANRHLPYETTLQELFKTGQELDGTRGFKVLHARNPRRLR